MHKVMQKVGLVFGNKTRRSATVSDAENTAKFLNDLRHRYAPEITSSGAIIQLLSGRKVAVIIAENDRNAFGGVFLNEIFVVAGFPKCSGLGSTALNQLVDLADSYHIPITVFPASLERERLERWYARFGFSKVDHYFVRFPGTEAGTVLRWETETTLAEVPFVEVK